MLLAQCCSEQYAGFEIKHVLRLSPEAGPHQKAICLPIILAAPLGLHCDWTCVHSTRHGVCVVRGSLCETNTFHTLIAILETNSVMCHPGYDEKGRGQRDLEGWNPIVSVWEIWVNTFLILFDRTLKPTLPHLPGCVMGKKRLKQ